MIQFCTQQYLELKQELTNCLNLDLPPTEEIEKCYSIAEGYWFRVKAALRGYVFKNKKEEILFFKEVKPRFLSEKEYYSLLYHAALFLPIDCLAEIDFWLRESSRAEKFIKENQDFYDYYKSGKTEMDGVLFVGEDIEAEGLSNASHSQLVAYIIALERYEEYVKAQVGHMKRNKSG